MGKNHCQGEIADSFNSSPSLLNEEVVDSINILHSSMKATKLLVLKKSIFLSTAEVLLQNYEDDYLSFRALLDSGREINIISSKYTDSLG